VFDVPRRSARAELYRFGIPTLFDTLLYALYRMGYHRRATVHGFRAVASTLLNEMGYHHDWIERQLAHDERNKVRAAYNHAQYLAERRGMMQHWADYLDRLIEVRNSITWNA
jgi:integrase